MYRNPSFQCIDGFKVLKYSSTRVSGRVNPSSRDSSVVSHPCGNPGQDVTAGADENLKYSNPEPFSTRVYRGFTGGLQ